MGKFFLFGTTFDLDFLKGVVQSSIIVNVNVNENTPQRDENTLCVHNYKHRLERTKALVHHCTNFCLKKAQ